MVVKRTGKEIMSHSDYAIDVVIDNEGSEFTQILGDHGGATKYGITWKLFKSIYPDATLDELRNLTKPHAKLIYKQEFWDKAPFEEINSMRIATSCFDAGVNSGLSQGVKLLQRAANGLLKPDLQLIVDGKLGKTTLKVVNTLDSTQLLAALRNERAWFYERIVERDPSQKIFLNGWLNRAKST